MPQHAGTCARVQAVQVSHGADLFVGFGGVVQRPVVMQVQAESGHAGEGPQPTTASSCLSTCLHFSV